MVFQHFISLEDHLWTPAFTAEDSWVSINTQVIREEVSLEITGLLEYKCWLMCLSANWWTFLSNKYQHHCMMCITISFGTHLVLLTVSTDIHLFFYGTLWHAFSVWNLKLGYAQEVVVIEGWKKCYHEGPIKLINKEWGHQRGCQFQV